MSDAPQRTTDPMAAMLDAQARFLDGSQRLTRRSLETNRRFARSLVNTMDAQRETERRAISLLDVALEFPVVAARTSTVGGEESLDALVAAYDDGVMALEDAHEEWWETLSASLSEGVDAYDDVVRAYAALMDASFEMMRTTSGRLAAPAPRGATAESVGVEIEEGEES